MGERQVIVARELTKIYEETRRGTLAEVAAWYKSHPPKGEIVIVVEAMNELNEGIQKTTLEEED